MKLRACLPSAGWTALVADEFRHRRCHCLRRRRVRCSRSLRRCARVPLPGELGIGHCVVLAAAGQSLAPEDMKAYEETEPPLLNHLGSVTFPVTTKSAEAQGYVDQAMRLAANFNHAEARRALRKAQRLDPTCAMCFAAEALILGPNINVPMDPSAFPRRSKHLPRRRRLPPARATRSAASSRRSRPATRTSQCRQGAAQCRLRGKDGGALRQIP